MCVSPDPRGYFFVYNYLSGKYISLYLTGYLIMKSIIAAGILLGASAPAFAGPYANVETNAGWTGGDYDVTVTEVHAGYEFEPSESAVVYVQGGPAFVSADGEDLETEFSGKVGVSVDVTENTELYGELAFITNDQSFSDDLDLAVKVGGTYRF